MGLPLKALFVYVLLIKLVVAASEETTKCRRKTYIFIKKKVDFGKTLFLRGAPPGETSARMRPAERPDLPGYAAYNGFLEDVNFTYLQWDTPEDVQYADVSQ